MNSKITRYTFTAGAIYFFFMAVAHFFSIKVPVLFVYYDTPFHAYQDKIISFAVCAYIGLFYSAAKLREVAPVAIIVLFITIIGLATVNLSDALTNLLLPHQSTLPYWLQTIAIAGYAGLLSFLYLRDGKKT